MPSLRSILAGHISSGDSKSRDLSKNSGRRCLGVLRELDDMILEVDEEKNIFWFDFSYCFLLVALVSYRGGP